MATHAFHEQNSNQLDSGRAVPDTRDRTCRWVKYDKDLPTTSVILCFHNEARSTLLRTVRSVISRPVHLLPARPLVALRCARLSRARAKLNL